MHDPLTLLILVVAVLAGLCIMAVAGLRGWNGWLDLKRAEIGLRVQDSGPPTAAARIEVADLKERIRRLEAIAAGVDL